MLQIDPANFAANYNLGILARGSQHYSDAAEYFEVARRTAPSDAATLLGLTEAMLGAGRKERAFSASRQLVALAPQDPRVRFSLGTLFLQWKEYEQAAEHLERARVAQRRISMFFTISGRRTHT